MLNRKSTDNLITLSLTEAAFILVFAVLVLIGSKLILTAKGEDQCRSSLGKCSNERQLCQTDLVACKSQLGRVTARPDDVVTDLVKAEKLRLENADLKTKLEAAIQRVTALKYLESKFPKEPDRLHAALELLNGFEAERGASLSGDAARKTGEEAAKAVKGLQNCLGQLKNCTSRLGPRGYGHPPCWTDTNGQIQYLFNVELRGEGVTTSRGWPTEREQDAKALPGAVELTSAGMLRLEEFLLRTSGIFQASRSASPECRHYVRLTRSPALKDIDLFNRLRLGVEDHFYKLDLTKTGS